MPDTTQDLRSPPPSTTPVPTLAQAAIQTPPQAPAREAEATRRNPIAALRHEIDRLFDDLGWPAWGAGRGLAALDPFRDWMPAASAVPAMDLVEREGDYELRVDLPGLRPEQVEVRLADGTLTLRGEQSESREEKEAGYHLRERSAGRFSRTLRLPPGVDPERVEARFADGVLRVTLPKTEAARAGARRIEIKGA